MKNKLFLFALLAFISTACNKSHDSKSETHEETALQLTAYSSEFEVFAEADPFVMGQSSGILSHFSHLPNFTALEEGAVTIRLIIEGKEVSQLLDKPTRKGIYKFELTPSTKGIGKIVYDFKIGNNNYQLIVPNIVVYATEEEAHKSVEAMTISRTNTTVFTKEQSWKIDFATDFPQTEPFGAVLKTTAQVQSAQGDEIIVPAKASGIVTFNAGEVLVGKSVSNGQTLLTISSTGLSTNNATVQFAEAKNNFEKASADYERAKELAKDQIVSTKDLLHAKNQYDNAKVAYNTMSRNFSASGQIVKSPLSGFIKQLYVQNGQNVEAGQPIVSVSQNKTLLLRADVQQKHASILGSIRTANIRIPNENKTYTLEQLNGSVLSYGKSADIDNYLIPVNLKIDNVGGFVSGSFVEVYLRCRTSERALTLPNQALLEEQGVYSVYVQVHPELFEKREVKIGETDGIRTEISSGITAKDRVVTKGVVMIKLAQATGTLDAHSGHTH